MWIIISKYFNICKICQKSRKLLFYNIIAIVWYGSCGLLNPNYENSIIKMPECNKALLIINQEIIEIKIFLFTTKIIANVFLLLKCQSWATFIPTISNFKLRYAKKERQMVDQKIANQKSKTGFSFYVTIIHFHVWIMYFHFDNIIYNKGYWSAFFNFITINK